MARTQRSLSLPNQTQYTRRAWLSQPRLVRFVLAFLLISLSKQAAKSISSGLGVYGNVHGFDVRYTIPEEVSFRPNCYTATLGSFISSTLH